MTIEETSNFQQIVTMIRSIYGHGPVPLHRPVFEGNEKKYLTDCIDSNFVSSAGEKVAEFERQIAAFTGANYAVATVNGTAALHIAVQLAGVKPGDEVITQALSFIATCNALTYAGAIPVFVDVDKDTLGLSPVALQSFLAENAVSRGGITVNKRSGRRIAACIPMHTFGHPCRIREILDVCGHYDIPVVEDAAESLGSYVGNQHTGTFGQLGTVSFNGNKVITTGGGGMILTNNQELATRAKHLSTTAKRPHPYEFIHDEIGYNYRLPNLNAALGCAQMENLSHMLRIKAEVAAKYADFFVHKDMQFVSAPSGTRSNYWLNAVVLKSEAERDAFLKYTNSEGIMTRPVWRLMSRLRMYAECQQDGLANSSWLEERVVNLPSSVPDSEFTRLTA